MSKNNIITAYTKLQKQIPKTLKKHSFSVRWLAEQIDVRYATIYQQLKNNSVSVDNLKKIQRVFEKYKLDGIFYLD